MDRGEPFSHKPPHGVLFLGVRRRWDGASGLVGEGNFCDGVAALAIDLIPKSRVISVEDEEVVGTSRVLREVGKLLLHTRRVLILLMLAHLSVSIRDVNPLATSARLAN
jgi:hypothetical protein